MTTIILGIFVFLKILYLFIFTDFILSWLRILGVDFRPKFLADIVDPMYNFVKKYIPTTVGVFDFAPIIVILGIHFLEALFIGIISS